MKLRRLVSCMMALLLVCSLPLSAFADTWYLDKGSITVEATQNESGGTTQIVSQKISEIETTSKEDANPTITQNESVPSTENTVTIEVETGAKANVTIQNVKIVISDDVLTDHSGDAAVTIDVATGAEANVTLDGVNIDVGETDDDQKEVPGEAAVQIVGNGDVTLELDGENTVQGGYKRAGVEKNTTDDSGKGELTITDENETHGSLNANGGDLGAGIGGGSLGSGSNITITGSAEVTATGGVDAAGIGGGNSGSGSDIEITGSAEVTAQGTDGGAGIGGGALGSGSDIKITGSAEVTAKGDRSGAGIGGGYNRTGSDITVSEDAQVKAKGGNGYHSNNNTLGTGAAIGGGGSHNSINGQEVPPNTNALNEGWIATYAPGTENMNTAAPDSLTYKDTDGTVQTVTESITVLPAQPATDNTHEQKAGFKVGDVEVAVKTHRYGNYQSDDNATCTHDGTESAKCTVPGCTAKLERTIPGTMLDHEFGEYIPDANNLATCTKAGTKTAKCKNCPATDTVIDPAKGHSMGEYYTDTPATCQKEGVERRDCDNCDYSETSPLKKVDHSYGDFASDNNATCTADGTKTRKCIWCGLKDTVPDPGTMKEHSMGDFYTATPATCQKDGVERRDCADCDYYETRTLDKLEHSFTNYISNNDATYDADGTKTAKCDHCDATDTIPDPGSRLVREETVQNAAPYRVVGQDGKALAFEKQQKGGVLTITVDADFATLTGSFSGLKTLKAQGIDTIVFVTNGATSTFALADLLAQGGSTDTYALTHDGKTVTFTLSNGTDISKILK